MQVRLEMDSRDEFRFGTFRSSLGDYRQLTVSIEGRPFATWYLLDRFMSSENYLKNVDDRLAREFEFMIGRLFRIAAKMIPDGFDLKSATDEEIRTALANAMRSIPGVKTDGI